MSLEYIICQFRPTAQLKKKFFFILNLNKKLINFSVNKIKFILSLLSLSLALFSFDVKLDNLSAKKN